MTSINRGHQSVVVDLTRGDWTPRAPSPKSPRLTRSDARNLVSSKSRPALLVFERQPPQEVYQVNSADILRTVQTERKGVDTQEQFTEHIRMQYVMSGATAPQVDSTRVAELQSDLRCMTSMWSAACEVLTKKLESD